ncbi:MAG: sulfur carrier protein ThiS [Lachnospiraceae bacterium]|nr:sulfur carrier protein ThiS [Lachnospiraceae bacterium]
MVKINGEDCNAAGMFLSDYLKENGYKLVRIAVERNGEIVPKAMYDQTLLADGDALEVVSFVGGG